MKPPGHLKPSTAKWWQQVIDGFDLDHHHVRLLTAAAAAWDRYEQARQTLDSEGITYTDRHGTPRARPEVAVERDSRIAFARLLRELALDVAPPDSRPPRTGGQRY